jgi:hypothetical protein
VSTDPASDVQNTSCAPLAQLCEAVGYGRVGLFPAGALPRISPSLIPGFMSAIKSLAADDAHRTARSDRLELLAKATFLQ